MRKRNKRNYSSVMSLVIYIIMILTLTSCGNKENEQVMPSKDENGQMVTEGNEGEVENQQLDFPPDMSVSVGEKKINIAKGTSSWTISLGDDKFMSRESDSEGPIDLTKNNKYTVNGTAGEEVYMNFELEYKTVEVNIFHSYLDIESVQLNKTESFTIPDMLSDIVYEIHVTYDQGDVYYALRVKTDYADVDEEIKSETEEEINEIEEEIQNLTDTAELVDLNHKGDYEWMHRKDQVIDPHTRKFGVIVTPLQDFNLIEVVNHSRIDFDGKAESYEYIQSMMYNVAEVMVDHKYGYINANGQQLTPIIFDDVYTVYYDLGTYANVALGDRFIHIDLKEGFVKEYVPYGVLDDKLYSEVIDLDSFEIVIVNGKIIVNGVPEDVGQGFPTILLNGLEFEVYQEGIHIGSYIGTMYQGEYDGQLNIGFDQGTFGYEFYATIGIEVQAEPMIEIASDTSKTDMYLPIVLEVLEAHHMANSEVAIQFTYKGDILGNGTTSVIVEVTDAYNRHEDLKAINSRWNEESFKEQELGLFDMIVFIEDVRNLEDYEVIFFDSYQYYADLAYPNVYIRGLANIDKDPGLELIMDLSWYEVGSYTVINIKE